MAKAAAIIPAAGRGSRFGGPRNKIFETLGSQPMFLRTLEAFTSRDDVVQTLLAVSPDDAPTVKERYGGNLGFMGVTVVEGGASRSESIRNAMALVRDEVDLVAIHDAARPCIAQPWIDAVFAKAAETGAAILAQPVVGTVKRVDDSRAITATLPRDEFCDLWEAQTPQVFRRELIARACAHGGQATDDAALVEALGETVHAVPGDARNIKVTTRDDLDVARAIINHLPKGKENRLLHPFQDDLGL
ncbi:MAG: 2-C-methyl-D-erythritol 4-phosphate cytidylyltransferase [Planctomycetes bacterium]|jgi:2-C-methyl-D-erythritol 4-phosphate cytidylyltransferase|nr:2-C-methyl-D-erythritol 4-phosphate cytidylyltransferase [Phycisphaerae bacterium]NBB95306.1 2-C-methyl-D-erythritol 4-phosphate cytidylyltransferase [Planctomycetota bacterium]